MRKLFPLTATIFMLATGSLLLWAGDAPAPAAAAAPATENLLTLNDTIKAALSVDPNPTLEQLPEGGIRLKYVVPESLEEENPVGDLNFEFNPPIPASAASVEIPTAESGVMLQIWNENDQHSAKGFEPGTVFDLDIAGMTTLQGDAGVPLEGKLAKFRITFPVDKAPGEHVIDITKLVITP